jgi:hypothetical protein
LWRLAFKRFRRLCLFIFKRRFFFRLPMVYESRFGPQRAVRKADCKARITHSRIR